MNPELPGAILALIGTIGTGKSTFAKQLSRELPGVLLEETIDGNPFMRDAHKTGANSFQNQVWFLFQTIDRWEIASDLRKKGAIAIMDTFTPTNIIHSKIILDNDSSILYDRLANRLSAHLPPPTLIIYLHDSVDFLMDRLHNKRHLAVDDEDAPYVEQMWTLYEEWAATAATIFPLEKIRSRDLENAAQANTIIQKIRQRIGR